MSTLSNEAILAVVLTAAAVVSGPDLPALRLFVGTGSHKLRGPHILKRTTHTSLQQCFAGHRKNDMAN